MKKNQINPSSIHGAVWLSSLLVIVVALVSCGGCSGGKVTNDSTVQNSNSEIQTDTFISQQGVPLPNWKPDPEIQIARNYLGKDLDIKLNPNHEGGEAWTTIWEENIEDPSFERMNRIVQLSPTVILYRRFPREVSKNFHHVDQPDKIEFLDTAYNTIKTIDIWKDRPYQDSKNAKLTYWNFDSEGMGVIPYTEQKTPNKPNEYSLFTDVRSEGNHVIVNYELRSIRNVKNFGMDGYSSDVVAVKHTIHIYDLKGNLKYVLKDLPSVDGAVVSNDGRYMMYIFGGMGLANTNSPFATIERSGWALMRLKDQKVVYQEYTDDGILAFGRLYRDKSGLLKNTYSTPSDNIHYDYHIYFDHVSEIIYKKNWEQLEWDKSRNIRDSLISNRILYLNKFNFQKIFIFKK